MDRRTFLRAAGIATAVGVAGCAGGGGGDGVGDGDGVDAPGNDTGDGDGVGDGVGDGDGDGGDGPGDDPDDGDAGTGDYPAVDEWLTETEVGGAADNYDGSLADRTGQDTVTIAVGAEGNDGSFAFDPAGVVVSAGTTVEWEWTGEGNPHNVVAAPDQQIGESDYSFSSGDPQDGSGVQYTQTMDEAGVALYHCEPHLLQGMKGGIGVASGDG